MNRRLRKGLAWSVLVGITVGAVLFAVYTAFAASGVLLALGFIGLVLLLVWSCGVVCE